MNRRQFAAFHSPHLSEAHHFRSLGLRYLGVLIVCYNLAFSTSRSSQTKTIIDSTIKYCHTSFINIYDVCYHGPSASVLIS